MHGAAKFIQSFLKLVPDSECKLVAAGDLEYAIHYQIFLRSDGTPDERALYRAALNVVLAVHSLHAQHGRVHGDVKPANFLSLDDPLAGATCANDPGALLRLADLEHSGVPDASTGIVAGALGTEGYSAPEVAAQGGATDASERYSVAATVRELLQQRVRTCGPAPPCAQLQHLSI